MRLEDVTAEVRRSMRPVDGCSLASALVQLASVSDPEVSHKVPSNLGVTWSSADLAFVGLDHQEDGMDLYDIVSHVVSAVDGGKVTGWRVRTGSRFSVSAALGQEVEVPGRLSLEPDAWEGLMPSILTLSVVTIDAVMLVADGHGVDWVLGHAESQLR